MEVNSISEPQDHAAFYPFCSYLFESLFSFINIFDSNGEVDVQFYALKDLFNTGSRVPIKKKKKLEINSFFEGVFAELLKIVEIEDNSGEQLEVFQYFAKESTNYKFFQQAKIAKDQEFVFSYPLPTVYSILEKEYGSDAIIVSIVSISFQYFDFYNHDVLIRPLSVIIDDQCIKIPEWSFLEDENIGNRVDGKNGTGKRQPLHTIISSEPSIYFTGLLTSLLLKAFTIRNEHNDNLSINGYALRHNRHWLVKSQSHPSEVYEYLARICNVECKFCYLYGNPDNIGVARGVKTITKDELSTRLKYWRYLGEYSLFKSQWEINEFLIDHRLPELLTKLRETTKEAFFFITNGNPLNDSVIELLVSVKPVHLIISTNTFDAPLRAQMMNEGTRNTLTAYASLEKIRDAQVPFGISLVAYPELSLEDIYSSLKRIEALSPAFVRINLPGFTKNHPCKFPASMIEEHWNLTRDWIINIRKDFSYPIITIPSSFEDNLRPIPYEPRTTGTIRNSPGFHGGVEAGDLILEINNLPIFTKGDALSVLQLVRIPFKLKVLRDNIEVDILLDKEGQYPFTGNIFGKYIFPHGIVLSPSLSIANVHEIKIKMESYKSHNCLIITSSIMLKSASVLITQFLPDLADSIHFQIVKNHFLSGNIQILDMATIKDIYLSILDYTSKYGNPDLCLIPSSGFNELGRDLAGEHWTILTGKFNFPVSLLETTSQFSF